LFYLHIIPHLLLFNRKESSLYFITHKYRQQKRYKNKIAMPQSIISVVHKEWRIHNGRNSTFSGLQLLCKIDNTARLVYDKLALCASRVQIPSPAPFFNREMQNA